ncbi:MAG: hypothetical protein A2481_02440 [Candidatus Yonathbacteria bacterium RIFOXYC2_FULL_47_9]|nr:MAG: hypothetical protein A2481_02440 [Candidatus Yonathbacteria bacterium RIFOXYC2_FULL_47_9]
MKDDIKNIKCPNCGESISIDDVLTHQIENKLKKDFEEKEKDMRASIEKESSEKLEKEKAGLEKKLKAQILKDAEAEKVASEEKNLLLEEQLAEKDAKLKEARQNELVLIKGNQKLKDDQESFELEKTRQLAEERKQIEEEASKKATDAKQSEIDQINKKLSDVTKAKDELARKLEQGSQQTQGEVQEIKLEELLKAEFIHDDISPVPKGVTGADVIQTVKTKAGVECGKIIWESKKTKSWTEGWIPKLKEDQRSVKADIAIIVSSVLPNGVEGIVQRDGVWICDIKLAVSIATALRHTLELVSREKLMSVGKNDKMEILYSYLSGNEFKQKIEVIVETFSNMKSSLDKERIYFEKSWAEKEKQIQKVIKNTVGIYGDLSGVVQLQKIESLELPAPKTDKEK